MSGPTPMPKTLPRHPLRRASAIYRAHARYAAHVIRLKTGTPPDTTLAGLFPLDTTRGHGATNTMPLFKVPGEAPGAATYWCVTHGAPPLTLALPGVGPWQNMGSVEQRAWVRATPGQRHPTLRRRRRTVWCAHAAPLPPA